MESTEDTRVVLMVNGARRGVVITAVLISIYVTEGEEILKSYTLLLGTKKAVHSQNRKQFNG